MSFSCGEQLRLPANHLRSEWISVSPRVSDDTLHLLANGIASKAKPFMGVGGEVVWVDRERAQTRPF
jgi:hypothetical protein